MKRTLILALVLALLAAVAPGSALAGKRKKKGPKPYKSETVDVAFGHPGTLVGGAGLARSVFEAECAIPSTNGTDGYVFEVPKQYQKIDATVTAFGSNGDYDIDLFIYDESCQLSGEFGSESEDEVGFISAGSRYVLAANYRPSPFSVRIELAPIKDSSLIVAN